MQIKKGKDERKAFAQRLRGLKERERQSVMFDAAEVLFWVQRLFAVREYDEKGASPLVTLDAQRLGIKESEVIDLYQEVAADLYNPYCADMAQMLPARAARKKKCRRH